MRLLFANYQYYLILSHAFDLIHTVIADTASDHLEFAKKLLNSGKYSDALPHFDEAVKNDPNNYLTYFKRAAVYLAISRPRPALEDLNKALEFSKDFTPALSQRAAVQIKMGNLDEAHIDYERLLSMEANNEEAMMMLNRIEKLRAEFSYVQDLIIENRHDEAIHTLNELVNVIPYNSQLLKLRAQTFVKIGDIRRAISDYNTVAKLDVDAASYLTIANMYYKLGEVEFALNNVRECLKLDPDHKKCMEFYKPTKKLNNHIQKMVDNKSSKDDEACVAQGRNALNLIKEQKKLLPLVYSIQSVMCHCLSRASNHAEGVKICDEALDNSHEGGIEGIALDKADLFCDKADLLAESERYAEALEMYQKSQEIKQSRRASEGIDRMKRNQRQKKKRDYYKILGVTRSADANEINRAYRKLAAKWHPDRHQGEDAKKSAEAKFMDIADAKAVLTDPKKRKQYDSGDDPLDPESKQHHHSHGFHGDPFGGFGPGGSPFQFKFSFG